MAAAGHNRVADIIRPRRRPASLFRTLTGKLNRKVPGAAVILNSPIRALHSARHASRHPFYPISLPHSRPGPLLVSHLAFGRHGCLCYPDAHSQRHVPLQRRPLPEEAADCSQIQGCCSVCCAAAMNSASLSSKHANYFCLPTRSQLPSLSALSRFYASKCMPLFPSPLVCGSSDSDMLDLQPSLPTPSSACRLCRRP